MNTILMILKKIVSFLGSTQMLNETSENYIC